MTDKAEIFAVVWGDLGIWMNTPKASADDAIEAAKAMHERATANGVTLHDLRAVHVPLGVDRIDTLWSPA